MRLHSTRGTATSWALFKEVPETDICQLLITTRFVWFYRLDVTALLVAHSILSVGSVVLAESTESE